MLGDNASASGRRALIDEQGNSYALAFAYGSQLGRGMALLKIDSTGQQVWVKTWTGNFYNPVLRLVDGTLYLAAMKDVTDAPEDILSLITVGVDGQQQWQDELTYHSVRVNDVDITDTEILVTADVDERGYLAKWDLNGNRLWQKKVTEYGYAYNITDSQVTPDGHIYSVGTLDVNPDGEENVDAAVYHFDENGEQIWVTPFALNNNSKEDSSKIVIKDGLAFASAFGNTGNGASNINALMAGVDINTGELLWKKTYDSGFAQFDTAWDLILTPQGHAALLVNVLGVSFPPTSSNVYVVDRTGKTLSNYAIKNINGANLGSDANGNLYTAGITIGSLSDPGKTGLKIVKMAASK